MKIKSPFLVEPGSRVKLSRWKTGSHDGIADAEAAASILKKHAKRLADLQELLYASQQKAVLIVLQGMDTAGKDGTISHIFSGVNPQGCNVASFKVPTALESRHDFLWRCHEQVPPRGDIGIFNRSHYEDVLSPQVHGAISHKLAQRRLDDIVAWEKTLTDNDVVILKFFLHISEEEQTDRLQSRIDDPTKHWKLSPADFSERRFWKQYMNIYEEIFEATSQKHAPWFIIPSDHKWYRNVAISGILVDALESLKLQYPKPSFDPTGIDLHSQSEDEVAKTAQERANAKQAPPPSKKPR